MCGRGFSEKRNLRHHIIRFHSDGSGRELLKRARKDKTLAATTKQLAASVLKKAALKYLSNDGAENGESHEMTHAPTVEADVKIEVDEDDDQDDYLDQDALSDDNEASYSNGNQNDSDNVQSALKLEMGVEGSSRRRKSKPSKKIAVETSHHAGERTESELDEDDESKNDDQDTILEDDEADNDETMNDRSVLHRATADGDMSSDSYGGNQSENSVEGSLSKLKNHGAFFSSYSPR